MKEKAIQLLRELTDAHGCPGCEHAIRDILTRELNDTTTDKNGSVICTTKGQSTSPKIMLEAHMDEVGFMVQNITGDGYLKIVQLGGWWAHTLLSHRVRILTQNKNEIIGVIACKPPHFLTEKERSQVLKIENMYVDIGARSADEVTKEFGVNLGDTVAPDSPFSQMSQPDLLLGKAFDDRVGVALIIQATQILRETQHPNLIYTVGSTQEEVGVRGIRSALNVANPDAAVIIEGAPADDFPGSNKDDRQTILGNGAQIRLMDASAIMNRPFTKFAANLAQRHSIPYQLAVRRTGGTDARAVQFHQHGVPTIVIAVPARYIHTHNSMIHIDDYLSTLELIFQILTHLDKETLETFSP